MAKRRAGVFLPLDTGFFMDEKVVEAGEAAAWLYLRMACVCKERLTDGRLSIKQVETIGQRGWRTRLDALLRVGLVVREGDAVVIPKWLEHNASAASVEADRAADRARKRGNSASNSDRNPTGVRPDSDRRGRGRGTT